jgi:multidrug efflux pump subunit AcrA (membrane-fusion protein)
VRYPAALGVDAVVRVPEIPDHTFPGEVARIADALDPATRTLMTEIDVPNPDRQSCALIKAPGTGPAISRALIAGRA